MKPAASLAMILLGAVATAHLLRLLLGVQVKVDGIDVPMWVSVIGCVVPAALAAALWHESRSRE